MRSTLDHVRIAGIVVAYGEETRRLRDEVALYGGDAAQIDRIARTVGLETRSVAKAGTTALDLGERAARRLLADLDVDPSSLDAVLFVTQTPDHSQPANANLLHGRLGLPKSALATDLNQGCSGFISGLHYAALLCAHAGAGRVLLCCGDTLSRLVNPRDRSVAPLFGDAVAAVLVERTGMSSPWHFSMGSDGSGSSAICVPAGGFRQPTTPAILASEAPDAEGNFRHPGNLAMSGAEVFNFSLREPPKAIAEAMAAAGWKAADVDALVCHQANRFIVQTLAKQAGFPTEKAPITSLAKHGNLSSASIPAALVGELGPRISAEPLRLVICGFGVGLSWGAVALTVGPIAVGKEGGEGRIKN